MPLLIGDHGTAALQPLQETRNVRGWVVSDQEVHVVLNDSGFQDQGAFLPRNIPQEAIQEPCETNVD